MVRVPNPQIWSNQKHIVYKKRGSASYIVPEVRSVRQRERERVWSLGMSYCHLAENYIVVQTPFPPRSLRMRTYFQRGPDSAFSTETSYPDWQSPYTYHRIRDIPGKMTRFAVRLKLFDPATGLSPKRFSRKFKGFLNWGEDPVCRVGYVRVGESCAAWPSSWVTLFINSLLRW